MGGTELYDIANFWWVNYPRVKCVHSFELDQSRYAAALQTATSYRERGIDVLIAQDDIFRYERETDDTHVYFVDLEGICGLTQYAPLFRDWFVRNVFRPGDLLLVTSYLGRNPGWGRILQPFDAEFKLAGLYDQEAQKRLYEVMHPSFVLHRALLQAGLQDELNIDCFGYVKYHDTSPMGLYGFTCQEGVTDFTSLVQQVPVFDTVAKTWSV